MVEKTISPISEILFTEKDLLLIYAHVGRYTHVHPTAIVTLGYF